MVVQSDHTKPMPWQGFSISISNILLCHSMST